MEVKKSLELYLFNQLQALKDSAQCFDYERTLSILARLSTEIFDMDKSRTDLFMRYHYQDFISRILELVTSHWGSCFTEEDRHRYLDVFFIKAPALQALETICIKLSMRKRDSNRAEDTIDREAEDKALCDECVRILTLLLVDHDVMHKYILGMMEVENKSEAPNSAQILLQPAASLLTSIPDLVYNRQGRRAPRVYEPAHYFLQLSYKLLKLSSEYDGQRSISYVFRVFCGKLSRIGKANYFVRSWIHLIADLDELLDINNLLEKHGLFIRSIPESCHESVLSILCLSNGTFCTQTDSAIPKDKYVTWMLLAVIIMQLRDQEHFRYVLANKILLSHSMDTLVTVKVIVDALRGSFSNTEAKQIGVKSDAFHYVFWQVAASWCRPDFSYVTDRNLEESICALICYSLRQMESINIEKEEWVVSICKGVQSHLDCGLQEARTFGMRIGEYLSRVLTPEQKLEFGLEDDDVVDRLAHLGSFCIVEAGSNEADKPGSSAQVDNRSTVSKAVQDPDEIIREDSDHSDNMSADSSAHIDSDSDASLSPYEMDDNEEDLEPPRPRYLEDLVAALQTENEREKTEAALLEAEKLLRRKPRDLDIQAANVAQSLLRLENRYDTPNFEELRLAAMSSLCALSPMKSIPYFVKQALNKEQMLQSRLDILTSMVNAAYELSERGSFRVKSSQDLLIENRQVPRLESSRTRRWGYQRNPSRPAKKNAFADHASLFFSPLLFGYICYCRDQAALKSVSDLEHIFLAHILRALGCFVECSGNTLQCVPMSKLLLEFAWVHRQHKQASVRRQIFFCLSRMLCVIPSTMLRQEFGSLLLNIVEWMNAAKVEDSDEGCRSAASLLLQSMNSVSMIV